MAASAEVQRSELLTRELNAILGSEFVLTSADERSYYSTDLSWRPTTVADIVIQPGSSDELARAVKVTTDAGYAIVQRGGGMSYTGGYQPTRADSVVIDMRRMNRIVELNLDDMYVTVECGCTWKNLYETLGAHGVRTPYWGPLSGMYATVGGALSQNSLFMGSGIYNTVAESVLGLEVVLADGSVLQTGSAAHRNSNGFYRHFGPDMTGIFTADTGAFGVKAKATLRLIESPAVTLFMSFGFDSIDAMLEAQTRIARKRICSECYGFDPYYNRGFEKQGFTFREGLATLAKVAGSGGIKGLVSAFQMATAGKTFLREVAYSLHMTFDAVAAEAAQAGLEIAREICSAQGGREIENSLPTAFRAQPFGGVRTVLLGSEGEIWIPVHGFMPLSRAVDVGRATEAFFAEHRAVMEEHGIRSSYLTCFAGTEFVIEPSLYWFDELGAFRLSLIEPEFREKWRTLPAQPRKREVALALRDGLRELYFSKGACHLQIAKYYPFQEAIGNEPLRRLLDGVKSLVDPARVVNPGSLGLR